MSCTCWWEDGKPYRYVVYDRQNQPVTIEEPDPASPALVYETSGNNGNGWAGMVRYQINGGAWVNKTGRGIWVIQLNKDTGTELAANRFDMHDDGQPTQHGTALAAHLKTLRTGRVVLIGVYDSGFNPSTNEWNEAAYSVRRATLNAMEKLGAQKIRRLGFSQREAFARDSYALVTVSGSPHNTIELHKKYVQRTSTSAECGIGTRIRPQAKLQYRYNAAGQRIYKQVGSNPAEHYVLDEDRILGVFRGSGLLYWNIYGNDGVAGRLEVSIPQEEGAGGDSGEGAGDGEVGGTQKLFYLKDHLGSTRAVMNTNGAVVESYDYYPFGLKMPGRIYPSTLTVTKNLFTGKELDEETGWYQLGSRSLMSALGRLPSPDRFADKYPSWSPYHYVLNNPVRFTDITGDTVDVDLQLLELVVNTEGEKKGQTKSLADMTPAERQRHFFQQWWAENQEMVNELFGIRGKYDTTNICFQLGTKPLTLTEKIRNFFTQPALKEPQFGQTA